MSQLALKVSGRNVALPRINVAGPRIMEACLGVSGGVEGCCVEGAIPFVLLSAVPVGSTVRDRDEIEPSEFLWASGRSGCVQWRP